jgi:hypothetical protein
MYTAASSVELGHRAMVVDMHWLPGDMMVGSIGTSLNCLAHVPSAAFKVDHKGELHNNPTGSALQVMTASPDGTCLVWDLRNDPKETPEVASSFSSLHLVWKPYVKVLVCVLILC